MEARSVVQSLGASPACVYLRAAEQGDLLAGLTPVHRHWLSWQNGISKQQTPSDLEMIGL